MKEGVSGCQEKINRFSDALFQSLVMFLAGAGGARSKLRNRYVSFIAAMDELCRRRDGCELFCSRVTLRTSHGSLRLETYLERLWEKGPPGTGDLLRLHCRATLSGPVRRSR